MPARTILNYESDARAVVEAAMERLSARPSDLALHKQLWEAGLRYKVAGGAPPGFAASLARPPEQPTARLLHYLRLWAFDVLNVQRMRQAHDAASACATPDGQFEPVVIWLRRKLRGLRAGA